MGFAANSMTTISKEKSYCYCRIMSNSKTNFDFIIDFANRIVTSSKSLKVLTEMNYQWVKGDRSIR